MREEKFNLLIGWGGLWSSLLAHPYRQTTEDGPHQWPREKKSSIYLLGGGAYGRACLRILTDWRREKYYLFNHTSFKHIRQRDWNKRMASIRSEWIMSGWAASIWVPSHQKKEIDTCRSHMSLSPNYTIPCSQQMRKRRSPSSQQMRKRRSPCYQLPVIALDPRTLRNHRNVITSADNPYRYGTMKYVTHCTGSYPA